MSSEDLLPAPPDVVGFRNVLRAKWQAKPQSHRWAITASLEALLAILLFFVDSSLGYAVVVIAALFWLKRLAPMHRLIVQGALIVLPLAISQNWSLVLMFAIAFPLFWLDHDIRGKLLPFVALLAAVAYPFYQPHLFTIPVFGVWPDVFTGVVMVVFVMMACGLNIVVGYAGLLDLGYVAFYATGAYTAAWFASEQFPGKNLHFGAIGIQHDLPGIHVSLWLLLLAAGLVTAASGVIIGLPTLRLRGDYLAIVTLGFGEILPQVARNGDHLFGNNITNGPNGITPLDSPGFGHGLSQVTGGFLPENYLTCCKAHLLGHAVSSQDVFFWTALVLLVITVFCTLRMRESRLGRAWIAIREDETAAAAMGIPLMRTKTWAYASGAFFGGIAGAYYASFKSATFPGDFFFNISVFILCMVILGGMGNIWGVIIGAAFLSYLDREGLANTGSWINTHVHVASWHPNIDVPLYSSGIYGVIIVLVMLFRPEGLLPSRRRAAEMHEGVHDQPLYDVAHSGEQA